jgi:SAM-dependent methyltransferase
LDVGCGDGHWWTHLIPGGLGRIHGIDVSRNEVNIASRTISAQCLDVTSQTFVEDIEFKEFGLIIGNCSLEHVFNIDKALLNINSVLSANGTFLLFVPTPYWALKGKSVEFLHRLSPRLSMAFSGFMNGFFQHWHLYNHSIWKSLLESSGFKVKSIYGLGNSRSEFLFRLGLPTAFIAFLCKIFTGKYLNYFLSPLVPEAFKKKIARKISESLGSELLSCETSDIFEYVIVCEK